AHLLLSQLASRSAGMKRPAIEGLARIGDAQHLAAINEALRGERNEDVLLAVGFANAALADAPVDPIIEAPHTPRRRDQALQYVVELSAPHRTALARALQEADPTVRAEIVEAFGLALDPAARPIVAAIVNDPDPQVARAAEWALARLR